MIKRFLIFLLLFFIILTSFAQFSSSIRKGSVTVLTSSIVLDSLSIVPNSLVLNGIDTSQFTVDYLSATLTITDSLLIGKTIEYSYRCFQYNFSKKYSHKPLTLITPQVQHYAPYVISDGDGAISQLFYDPALQSSGSISRKFSIGNNQDFTLNSALNLQLVGELSEDLSIVANITDKNVPIQPEGNSRMIQDFNKIFLQLNYKNKLSLLAGDIDITGPESFFLKVNRQVLGMKLLATTTLDSSNSFKNDIGGGVSKGRFIRNDLISIEGVQGPYRLYNSQQETNIMIVAGSEQVFIDGQLLVRGENNDYTIDYNVGEITFTARQLITREKRIVVIFEYTNFAYLRYSLFSYNQFKHEKNKKLKVDVNFYQEHDLKNRSIQPELKKEQMYHLSQIGDSLANATYPMVDRVPFNSSEILYKKIDTVVDGITYLSVFQHTNNPHDECFRVKFNYLGNHKGNYTLLVSSANGRVFQWVAPVNNVPQGDYEPVMLLSTPQLLQMATIGAAYEFSPNSELSAEIAFSNFDKNTFSKKNDENNLGLGGKLNYVIRKTLFTQKKQKWDWNMVVSYEFMSKNFQLVEAIRELEFSRMFNLSEDYSEQFDDHLFRFSTEFNQSKIANLKYHLTYFSRLPVVNALRNEIVVSTQFKSFTFNTITSYLYSKNNNMFTSYINTDNLISKEFKYLVVGVKENLEYDLFKDRLSNRLEINSFAFNDIKFFIKNQDSTAYKYQLSYKNRVDHRVNNRNMLSLHSMVHEAQGIFEMTKLKNHKIRAIATYRNSALVDSANLLRPEHYGVGSIDYTGRFLKNFIILSTFYEVGNGMEQKRNYAFIKVFDGQGTHVWKDYNNNGIAELDEFEIALFRDEANYIKVWLASNDYVNTLNNQFSQTLQIRPASLWYKKTGFLKFLTQFSNVTSLRITQKNLRSNSIQAINPFYFNSSDSNIINQQWQFKNTFSYNHYSSIVGADFILQNNLNKSLLYYGFEQNRINVQEFIFKLKPHKILYFYSHYSHSLKKNDSEYFESRNYQVDAHLIENSLQLTLYNNFDIILSYLYQYKRNLLQKEKATRNQVELSALLKLPEIGNLSAKIEYASISYNENDNSSLAYEMLEGLKIGNNFIWSLNFQILVNKFLELNLQYDGRSFERKRLIHTGNLQLRAHF